MAGKIQIRRKVDNVILTDSVTYFSDWFMSYQDPTLITVNGATYRQHFGIAEKHAVVKAVFSDKYPSSTMAHYEALINADRNNRVLQLKYWNGTWQDFKFQQPIGEPEPIEDIKHFGIFIVEMRIMQLVQF